MQRKLVGLWFAWECMNGWKSVQFRYEFCIFFYYSRYDQAADALRREICLNQQTESYQAIGR